MLVWHVKTYGTGAEGRPVRWPASTTTCGTRQSRHGWTRRYAAVRSSERGAAAPRIRVAASGY